MAGNENSGGFQPNAPQNNPMNVSGVGGAGQSGNYTGFAYGQNSALNNSRVAGNAAVASVKAATPSPSGLGLPAVPQLTDPTQMPDQPVTAGANAGPGPGQEALQLSSNMAPDNTQANKTLDSYYPVMNFISSRPSTSAETRQVLSLLMRGRGV
jgi:hypothetical protein